MTLVLIIDDINGDATTADLRIYDSYVPTATTNRRSTTELRRPAGAEFIGSPVWAFAARRKGPQLSVKGSAKDDVLSDFPEVYPGLTRPEVERLLTILDQSAGTEGNLALSIATALKPLVPGVAQRVESYHKTDDVDDYVRILRGGVVLLLQRWPADGESPSPDSVTAAVESVEADA